ALLTTHCTTPVWSRRSTNARCSPCSRRLATQPHTLTVRPSSVARRAPQYSVRIVTRGTSRVQPLPHMVDDSGGVDRLRLALLGERTQRPAVVFHYEREAGARTD